MPDSVDETLKIIDSEAIDETERRESRVLYETLRSRKKHIGTLTHIPNNHEKLSEEILNEARTRSAEIRPIRRREASQSLNVVSKPIPWWLWIAWLVAICGVLAAFRLLI